MILEFVINKTISHKIVTIMTIWYGINYHDLKMDNNNINNKQNRLSNNTTQLWSQENIIQKWTFKLRLQTITTTNNPRNKNTNNPIPTPKIEIQPSLYYKLEYEQLKHNCSKDI